MEKGFHNIEQFIAFITPGHTAFHERLSIGYIVAAGQESFLHIRKNLHLLGRNLLNCSMQQFKEQLVLSIGTKLAVFLYHSQVLSGAGHRQKLRKSIGILETFGGKAMWQRNNGQAEDDLQFRLQHISFGGQAPQKRLLIQLISAAV